MLSFLTKNHFGQSVDAILEDVSVAEQLLNAKLLIPSLPSFSVPKMTVVWHVQPGWKMHQTWQIRSVLKTQTVALNEVKYIIWEVFQETKTVFCNTVPGIA